MKKKYEKPELIIIDLMASEMISDEFDGQPETSVGEGGLGGSDWE